MMRGQRGFSLLEVLVAIALTTGVLLAVTAAVLNSLHTTALAEERSTLADDALNALVDCVPRRATITRCSSRSQTTALKRRSRSRRP